MPPGPVREGSLEARPRALAVGAVLEQAGPLAGHLELAFLERLADHGSLRLEGRVDVVLVDGALEPREVVTLVRSVAGQEGPPPLVVVGAPERRSGFLEGLKECGPDLVALDSEVRELPARVAAALDRRRLELDLQRREAELERLRRRLASMQDRVAEELRIAASVQRSLLPPPFLHPDLEVAAEFMPMREIGGDHYDVVQLDRDRVALAIGDVMGKGVPAALLAVNLKAVVRSQLQAGEQDLDVLMTQVNRVLLEVMPRGRFATFFFGVFDFARRSLEYVNAGHHQPFLVRPSGELLDLGVGGTVLGLLEDAVYERGAVGLSRGDQLVAYTDGVTDRGDRSGELFGLQRLKESARRSRGDSARIALYSLLGELQGFSAGVPLEDDLTLLVARVR
jgi:serine phosphatase RsbU (regulator of sigma subunit)